MRNLSRLVPWVLVVACGGTVQTEDSATGGSGGTGGSAVETGGSGAAAGQGGQGATGGSSGAAGQTGGTGGTEDCSNTPTCFADTPCFDFSKHCVQGDPTAIFDNRDIPCWEICGTTCCTGGGCEVNLTTCEPGKVCAYPNANPDDETYALRAECVDSEQACGGPLNQTCPAGSYCEYAGMLCPKTAWFALDCAGYHNRCDYFLEGGLGTCRPLPSGPACDPSPVCGCDGITYESDCDRMKAGTAFAAHGACP